MIESIIGLICASVIVEGLITYVKTLVDKDISWQMVASVVLGIIVSISYGLDLFAISGMTSAIPFVGQVLTGILLSRGSNYIFHIIKTLRQINPPSY